MTNSPLIIVLSKQPDDWISVARKAYPSLPADSRWDSIVDQGIYACAWQLPDGQAPNAIDLNDDAAPDIAFAPDWCKDLEVLRRSAQETDQEVFVACHRNDAPQLPNDMTDLIKMDFNHSPGDPVWERLQKVVLAITRAASVEASVLTGLHGILRQRERRFRTKTVELLVQAWKESVKKENSQSVSRVMSHVGDLEKISTLGDKKENIEKNIATIVDAEADEKAVVDGLVTLRNELFAVVDKLKANERTRDARQS